MKRDMIKIEKKYLREEMELALSIYDMRGNVLVPEKTKLKDYQIKSIQQMSNVNYVYIFIPKAKKEEAVDLETEKPLVNVSPSLEDTALVAEETNQEKSKIKIEVLRESVITKVKDNMSYYAEQTEGNLRILFEVVEQIISEILSSDNLLYEINRIQTVDDYLYNHAINTSILSLLIGISVGFKTNQLYSLGRGAFFSDIGKLQIDPLILLKPNDLSDGEFDKVKKYPEYGYSFMKHFEEMDENALDCILHCREKIDGTGYPHGLKGNQISLYAQIVSLASFFDSLCSEKAYRASVTPYKAMSKVFDEEGSFFHKDLIKKAIKILGYYDVGMFVELQSSEFAKVSKAGRYRPVLTVIQSSAVKQSSHIYEIDMERNPSVKIKDTLVKSEYGKLLSYI